MVTPKKLAYLITRVFLIAFRKKMAYFIVGGFIIAIPTLEVWKKLQGNNQCIFRSSHLRNYHPYRSAINMNMSKHLRKSSQTTTSFVISYAYAFLWTFLEMPKFNERCLQRTDAALQVSVWDVWGCQSVFAKTKSQNRCVLRLEFMCKEDWNEDHWHPN